jgi:hypothetical protein
MQGERAITAAERINARVGWRAANPAYTAEGGYVGGVVLSTRGAEQLLADLGVPTSAPLGRVRDLDSAIARIQDEDRARALIPSAPRPVPSTR